MPTQIKKQQETKKQQANVPSTLPLGSDPSTNERNTSTGETSQKVSLVIITLNEEANIERAIQSVPWVDEVVVLDSGSTDRTVEIAQRLGARTFVESWRGYRDQKVRAADLAQNDWILSLDADEALSAEAAAVAREFLDSSKQNLFDGVEFTRVSFNLGRWIRHGGWFPDRQLRLYHRQRAGWRAGHVHERVEASRVLRVPASIQHWPFATHAEQVNTNNNYSTLGAKDLLARGKSYSHVKLVFKPVSKFIECYFLKRGFLDGWAGYVIAVGAAYSIFLKFVKLREMEQNLADYRK